MTGLEAIAILTIGAIVAGALKKQASDYPNKIYASPHFKWTELLKSGGQPTLAATYRKRYPAGRWPYLMDSSIWIGRRYSAPDGAKFVTKAYPELSMRSISGNMVQLLNQLIEPMRHDLGDIPLTVISGWRPPEMNTSGGQAFFSGHVYGAAIDIKADRAASAAERELRTNIRNWLVNRQRTVGDIGYVGYYRWGVHIGLPRWDGDAYRP